MCILLAALEITTQEGLYVAHPRYVPTTIVVCLATYIPLTLCSAANTLPMLSTHAGRQSASQRASLRTHPTHDPRAVPSASPDRRDHEARKAARSVAVLLGELADARVNLGPFVARTQVAQQQHRQVDEEVAQKRQPVQITGAPRVGDAVCMPLHVKLDV